MIESAQILSKQELTSFFLSISKSYNSKKINAINVLETNKQLLIDSYYELESEQVKEYYAHKKDLLKLKSFWDNKICDVCESKLRLVESDYGDFWGCPNYKDTENKHRTFSIKTDEYLIQRFQDAKVRINSNWATDIIRKNEMKSIVTASDLLRFYDSIGFEDLREKYGYRNSIDRISGYLKAKKESSIEEKEINQHLSKLFSKSSIQTGIRYKLKDQPEKVAIIDLILSNNSTVNIVEIKRSKLDINEEQLKLYHSLICHILHQTGDNRICKSLFLVYNKMEYDYPIDCKYLLYDEIKHIFSEDIISSKFDENLYTYGS